LRINHIYLYLSSVTLADVVEQRILGTGGAIHRRDKDGIGRCRIVMQPKVISVSPRPMRPFQGWRYLEAKDAPPDLSLEAFGEAPPELAQKLRELGAW